MSGSNQHGGPGGQRSDGPHGEARVVHRQFSFVWLIPIVAGIVALYLGWQTLEQRGPLITITFNSGDGLAADQTPVKYKAVQLGTVESVRLAKDMSHVIVRVRMRQEAADRLTDHARFWVVRPRITSGNISGLETIVSGAYIAMDPGEPGGRGRRDFAGLENPPGRRSDEPGTTYTLKADTLGGIGQGSPLFYREISVGEVLGYDQPGLDGKITVHVFVRAPYDRYVRDGSHFWNTSGLQVKLGGGGIKVQMESIQAVLAGGIAFSTPPESRGEPPARNDTDFVLYKDYDAAVAATSKDRIPLLTYVSGSARGLDAGAAVEIDGMRVGSITSVQLQYDAGGHAFRVAVQMAVEPEQLSFVNGGAQADFRGVLQGFIQHGMRAELQTSSYLTGSMVVELTMPEDGKADAKPVPLQMQGDMIVIPSHAGGIGHIVDSLSDIAGKLNKMPFEQIGNNLNGTLVNAQQLLRHADQGLGPVLKQLPQTEASLNSTLDRANQTLQSVNNGYGQDSAFHHNVAGLMNQAEDALRSIRALADFLNRHPEALLRGRAGEAASR